MQPFHIGKISSPRYVHCLHEKPSFPTLLDNVKECFEDAENIDYISDDKIISRYGTKIATNSQIRNFSKGTIAQIRKALNSNNEQKAFPDRFERLFRILGEANDWEGMRKELIESFLDTDSGQSAVSNYITENRDEYFKHKEQDFLSQLEEKHSEKTDELDKLEKQKEEVESEIRGYQRQHDHALMEANESNEFLETLSKEEKEKLDTEITEKKQVLEDLKTNIAKLKNEFREFDTVDKLNKEIEGLERDRDRVTKQKGKLEDELERVRGELKAENDDLTSRLLKLKPDVDALSGIAPPKKLASTDYKVSIKSYGTGADETRENLIRSTLEALDKLDRKTDYNIVTNILTTIAQSQFTLFSGRPGTGKTSLAKMLGESLGLQKRLLNIPVARGWTSSKDVLGFYNALSSSFSSASTGLYDLLTQLNVELKEKQDGAPVICLLDEFNLSQPEHYFSPFLEIADPESKRTIATGNPNAPELEIPQYLRFLGTINNDESVQSLTPRMLDRSSIISFDEIEPNYDLSLNNTARLDKLDIKPISGKEFINAFAPKSLKLPSNIEQTLKRIVDTLRDDDAKFGTVINVSVRKIKAIQAYYNTTSSMYIGSRFIALDYAVSQHIIPLLNGHGKEFGQRLEGLRNDIPDEMEISNKMLKRIIDIGNQNMFTYGFNL